LLFVDVVIRYLLYTHGHILTFEILLAVPAWVCTKYNIIIQCDCSGTIENLKSKNSVAMMKLTGETDKRRQIESQLNSAEKEKEKLKLERVRQQIKMDELKMKLRQGT
jgi:hypothetical protein